MKRWHAYLISGGWVIVLAGCGFGHPEAITHNSKPKAVASEILSRMSSWQNVRATVKETEITSAHQVKTLNYQVTSNLPSGQYVINLLGSRLVSVYVNSHETIWYPQNSKHYSVLAGLPATDAPWMIAAELPKWLRQSQVHGVRVKGDKVSLMMTLVPPSSKSPVDALLIYDTSTNTPESFSMQVGKTKITETFSHFQVNPNVPASTFSFSPPQGVTPAISLTQTGTALNLAKSQLNFPIVLPPSSAGMTLDAINTGTNTQGQRVVILSFTAQDSSSVIITEKSTHHPVTALPNSNLTSTTQSVGSLTVVVANLPDNMEEAAFSVHNTEVIVEGNASTVDSLLNQWGNLPSLTSSALASSGSTPSSP